MKRSLEVLLIEDEPLITFLFEDMLAGTEFSVQAVMTRSGPVLRHLDSQIPDVAIVDLILEDGSCVHVIERLLALSVPVVVVSGHPDAEEFAARDGASFIAKPFYSKVLLRALRSMVSSPVSSCEDERGSGDL
jgi:DNA-binding response OmpR family regulator